MILLRHGQSEFNLHFTATKRDPGIADPKLTELGHAQAAAAAEALAGEPIRRIICSPYTRALQTAAPVARRCGLPVHISPAVRERYAFTCDVGSPRTLLGEAWPDLDFAHIEEVWWPPVEERDHEIEARAAQFRAEMASLTDWRETLVISHWGFILAMTGQRLMNGEWLRCDPTLPAPVGIAWRAPHVAARPEPADGVRLSGVGVAC
jgi:broad specificity phosphatase PhoE